MRITDFPELIAPTGNDLLVTVDIANDLTKKVKLDNLPISLPALTALATKQDSLVSGVTIKTINSTSLLGSGNITIAANPSGVSGAIQFSNGSAFASDASNLFWDDTNNRLGIGTNAPINNLTVIDSTSGSTSGDKGITVGNSHTANVLRFGSYFNVGVISVPSGPLMLQTPASNKGVSISTGYLIPTAMAHIQGSGSTSATTSLLVQNSAGNSALQVQDNLNTTLFGSLLFGNGNTYINNQSSSIVFAAVNTATADLHMIPGRQMNINNTGSYTAQSSALLQVDSTTKGVLFPRMTTILRDAISSPANGLVLYNTTTNKLQCYNGSTWNDLF
jgi:hypothetical protein